MVQQTGESNAQNLRIMAKEAHERSMQYITPDERKDLAQVVNAYSEKHAKQSYINEAYEDNEDTTQEITHL